MPEYLTPNQLRRQLTASQPISDGFVILRSIALLLNQTSDEAIGHEFVLRGLDRREEFRDAAPLLDALALRLGLYPYIEPDALDDAGRIAYEWHRPLNMDQSEIVFHRVQAEVYRQLFGGRSVILSAPTSFGKSLIIDAMIATGRYKNIAVIVPTIALIDETRRRLSKFRGQYKLITHSSQHREGRNIFVVTQERLIELDSVDDIDFFVIDEFYKLQLETDEDRGLLLNHAFYKLLRGDKQFYLLGPNINGIPAGFPERFQCSFIRTDYATVVSEVRRVRADDEDTALVNLCRKLAEPTLIYCSSPARVRAVAKLLGANGVGPDTPAMYAMADWVGKEYHAQWAFVSALRRGIGVHHGRVPRALAQMVVRSFNEEALRFLVCTSTLIEGVNTKAKNVIILDNKVARKKFDYFTFNNIKGRSGRMFQHFIGRVYVFHDPPQADLPFVDFPWYTQDENTPTGLLIQMDGEDLTTLSEDRLRPFLQQKVLDPSVLRANVGIDPASQIRLAEELAKSPQRYSNELAWTGMPTYSQLEAVCRLIWDYLVPRGGRRSGVVSGPQLAFKINQLRSLKSIKALIAAELRGNVDPDEAVENVLEFLRHWPMFHFPRLLRAVDSVQRHVIGKAGMRVGDYSVFGAQVENLFIDPAIFGLDEYGVPIQIGQQLARFLDPQGDLDLAILRLRSLDVARLPLSAFEKVVVQDAQKFL